MTDMATFHLVRVTTDDGKHRLWVVAADTREKAIENVLKALPEGWTATIVPTGVKAQEAAFFNLKPGEAREITFSNETRWEEPGQLGRPH